MHVGLSDTQLLQAQPLRCCCAVHWELRNSVSDLKWSLLLVVLHPVWPLLSVLSQPRESQYMLQI